jgi:hypothetical protein
MSAFTESSRSRPWKSCETKVRFRPEAAIFDFGLRDDRNANTVGSLIGFNFR